MASLKIFLVLALAQCVFSGKLIKKHCESDSENFNTCVEDVIQEYFREHSGGVPEDNLKAVDPVTIPELIINDDDFGFKLIYKNVKVTGFKDVIFSDFKINPKSGRAEFAMKFDMNAEGDLTTELTTQGKTFPGTFKYEGNVKADTKYSYTEKKVNNEKSVYIIGPETTICEATNVKETYSQDVTDAFEKDPDTQKIVAAFGDLAFAKEYSKNVICKIATVVFQEAIDVVRTLGQIGD